MDRRTQALSAYRSVAKSSQSRSENSGINVDTERVSRNLRSSLAKNAPSSPVLSDSFRAEVASRIMSEPAKEPLLPELKLSHSAEPPVTSAEQPVQSYFAEAATEDGVYDTLPEDAYEYDADEEELYEDEDSPNLPPPEPLCVVVKKESEPSVYERFAVRMQLPEEAAGDFEMFRAAPDRYRIIHHADIRNAAQLRAMRAAKNKGV